MDKRPDDEPEREEERRPSRRWLSGEAAVYLSILIQVAALIVAIADLIW